ncbi:MAG: hypothetical protein ACLQGP_10420 [Isosphaeraceae bacterium]
MTGTLSILGRGRWASMIGAALLAVSVAGCGPTETPPPSSGTPAPAPTETTPEAKTKGGAPKADTTSRRELQKKRAAERAKSGTSE